MRNLLLVILLILVVGYVYYREREPGSTWSELFGPRPATTGGPLDPAKAREVGAEIGERTAHAANTVVRAAREAAGEAASAMDERTSGAATEAGEKTGGAAADVRDEAAQAASRVGGAVSDGSMTARIKSALALDEVVQARNVSVETNDGVVTLAGVVGSEEERARAMDIARRTPGVKRVVDRLKVGR
ncbi:MAG: BON domain-containing protein [Luteitalea sp.]|nr:BON domain-containing protein [Luteitalea sp.]